MGRIFLYGPSSGSGFPDPRVERAVPVKRGSAFFLMPLMSTGGGRDGGLNGIKTAEITRPTSAPGSMPHHPTPRTLKPLAVREVDERGTHHPALVGFSVIEGRTVHACLLSCLPLPLALSSLPQTTTYPHIT